MKTKIQQGDLILIKIDSLPNKTKKILSKKRCILAEGEHTGHNHAVEDDEAELLEIGEKMILCLQNKAVLTHQEHKPITLDPGIWEIGRIQEFDYFSMMARQVMD